MKTNQSARNRSADQLKSKIQKHEARVGIIGLGYVGLPLALLFSEQKFRVTGFDTDAAKVEKLNDGRSYIVRIHDAAIAQAQKTGFKATSQFAEIAEMDAVIICVPTPLNEH